MDGIAKTEVKVLLGQSVLHFKLEPLCEKRGCFLSLEEAEGSIHGWFTTGWEGKFFTCYGVGFLKSQ